MATYDATYVTQANYVKYDETEITDNLMKNYTLWKNSEKFKLDPNHKEPFPHNESII